MNADAKFQVVGSGKLAAGLLLWLAGVVAVSALLAPVLFHAAGAWGWAFPFERVFNRALMVSAVLLLVPLWFYWGRPEVRVLGLFWPGPKPVARETGVWFVVGAASLLAIFFWYLGWGARELKEGFSWGRLPGFFLSGLVVGLLEEPLFRGFFFLALLRGTTRNPWKVAVVTSVFFAATHFLKAPEWSGPAGWDSGFVLWVDMVRETVGEPGAFLRWSGLFWTGLCLCALAWRQGHLWGAIGLHAGWVFLLKTFHALSDNGPLESPAWFAPDVLSGLWTQLLLMAMVVWMLQRKRG